MVFSLPDIPPPGVGANGTWFCLLNTAVRTVVPHGDVRPSGVLEQRKGFENPSGRQWCSLLISKPVTVESGPQGVSAEKNLRGTWVSVPRQGNG